MEPRLFDLMKGQPALWAGVRRNLENKVSDLHRMLERPVSETETATIRGRIQQIRLIIDEVEAPKVAATRAEEQSKVKPQPSIY